MQTIPVFAQFLLVHGRPFQHHSQSTSRKPTPQDGEWVDTEFGFHTSVDRMKMCWVVVIEVHANGDPKKTTYFRHPQSLPICIHAANVRHPPAMQGAYVRSPNVTDRGAGGRR